MNTQKSLTAGLLAVAALLTGIWLFSDKIIPAPAQQAPVVTAPVETPVAEPVIVAGDVRLFGYVRVAYAKGWTNYIAFDAAELFSGTDAMRESIADGQGEPANGFYVRNPVVTTTRYPVAADATVIMQSWSRESNGTFTANESVAVAEWIAQLEKDGKGGMNFGLLPYWIIVRDGTVVDIREQVLP